MDIRIGVTYTAKELVIDLGDDGAADAVRDDIDAAIASGGVLWLSDKSGRRVGVPVEKVAYVEIGPDDVRRIGFAT